MSKGKMIKSVLSEYGISWVANRSLYSLKLKCLNKFSFIENIFEHSINPIKRLDIFDIDTKAISNFLMAMEEKDKNELIQNADLAMSGKIKAFSSILLDYRNPMRWNYNPITQESTPMDYKWYRIADFDNKRGDIKVIWEASRFSHFYLFSRAYLLTKNRKYYEAFHTQLCEWVKKNPYSYGANYKCGQECSIRLVNTLINYTVFLIEGLVDDEDTEAIKQIVEGSYKKVLSNFFYADKCVKNNHTISELLGMIIGAWCCGDQKQLLYGYQKMNKVIEEQFFDDGGYRQYSFNYQRLVLQDIECLLSISSRTGYDISETSKNKVLKSALMLYQMQTKDGNIPNYGSNDGALIFPVTSCSYTDYRPIVQCIYALLEQKKLYESGIYDEELLWFGIKGMKELSLNYIPKYSMNYSDIGLYQFRTKRNNLVIVLNNLKTRPAHYDQLHLDLWIGNKNVLCDSGTYSYVDNIGRELTKTIAHNTVKILGKEQMNKHGAFLVYNWMERGTLHISDNYFEGTAISANGYIHTRKIEIKENNEKIVYEVLDTILTDQEEEFEIVFHTPYIVREIKDGIEISDLNEELCVLRGNNLFITECYRSVYYMKKEKIKCICFRGRTKNRKGISKITIETRR